MIIPFCSQKMFFHFSGYCNAFVYHFTLTGVYVFLVFSMYVVYMFHFHYTLQSDCVMILFFVTKLFIL